MIDLKEIEFTPADGEQVEDARKAIARHLNRRNQKDRDYETNHKHRNSSNADAPYAANKGNGSDRELAGYPQQD